MQAPAIDTLGGLPAHPAFVHVPVVLVPLAFILALTAVWQRTKGWALPAATVAAIGGLFGALLAGGTGEALQHSVRSTELVRNHVRIAEQVNFYLVPFTVLLCLLLFVQWARTDSIPFAQQLSPLTRRVVPRMTGWSSRTIALIAAVACLFGALATWKTLDAGHTGAKSVWKDVKIIPGEDDDD